MNLTMFSLLLVLGMPGLVSAWCWESLEKPPIDFVDTACWTYLQVSDVELTVDECFDIVLDSNAFQYWHPEVMDRQWIVKPDVGVIGRSEFTFSDAVFNILLLGSMRLRAEWDVYEISPERKRSSFWFTEIQRPNILTFTRVREEFLCEKLTDTTTRFTRKVGADPGVATALLFFITCHRMHVIFEEKCPERYERAVANGDLPTGSTTRSLEGAL